MNLKDLIECSEKVKQNPNNAWLYDWRGKAKFGLNNYKGAIEDWERAIKLAPDYKDRLQPEIDKAKKKMGK